MPRSVAIRPACASWHVHKCCAVRGSREANQVVVMVDNAETQDRTGDLQIFSLTLSQLSYRGCCCKGCRLSLRVLPISRSAAAWLAYPCAWCVHGKWAADVVSREPGCGLAARVLNTIASSQGRATLRGNPTCMCFMARAQVLRRAGLARGQSSCGDGRQCRDPGSNWGPSDLQSDALPTELSRLKGSLSRKNFDPSSWQCMQYKPHFQSL